jgi:hypothetical protein
MRYDLGGGKAAVVGALLGLLALAAPVAALDVTGCANFSASTETRFDIQNDIAFAPTSGTCLTFPRNSTVRLNGHVIAGPTPELGTTGIDLPLGDGSILGPGVVRDFGTCIKGGDHVAVEDLITKNCATGIKAGDSYKIKAVRVHHCETSTGPNIGLDLTGSAGGFIESSIVRECDFGVITGKNNTIWNLVISRHNVKGLQVGPGTSVSRTVISRPRSYFTIGLDYRDCCVWFVGCQDGSNSVQDHLSGFNIATCPSLVGGTFFLHPGGVVTDTRTNCGGARVPFDPARTRMNKDC